MLITQLAVVLLAAITSSGASDSLKEAYHMIQKRADRMASPPAIYYSRPYIYGDGQPENIGYGYQKNMAPVPDLPYENIPASYADMAREEYDERAANALEKLLLDYIEESKGPRPRYSDNTGNRKRAVFQGSTIFRERDPDMIQRALEEAQSPEVSSFRERGKGLHGSRLRGGSNSGSYNLLPSAREAFEEEEYLNAINQVLERYRDEQDPEDISQEDLDDVLEYLGAKDSKKRPYGDFAGIDAFNAPMTWKRSSGHMHKRYNDMFDERYQYRGIQKRFPITKRSPSYYPYPLERKKKSEVKTDAKTAAELNNIFDTTPNSSAVTPSDGTKPSTTKKDLTSSTTTSPGQKEQALVGPQAGKPLELKKKSIDWSKYFGLDRKKKSSDWLVDQYLRQYGINQVEKRRPQQQQQKQSPDDVDSKMRAMEDMIVDEALKYTGAHEGSKDAKEIQEVKDKVMAQLAAAYSLEKMRRALGEFKASIAAQKATAPSSHAIPPPKSAESFGKMPSNFAPVMESRFAEHEVKEEEKKRLKTTISPKLDKKLSLEPNMISDIDGGDDYNNDCPVIDEITSRCQKITAHFMKGDKFMQICGFHQLCSACGADELRFVTNDQCNEAYTNEMTDYCDGDRDCLEAAEKSLAILTDDRASRRWYGRPPVSCDYWSNPCLSNIIPRMMSRRR